MGPAPPAETPPAKTPAPFCRISVRVGAPAGAAGASGRPRREDTAAWFPPGCPVTVNGHDIADGMVYVGSFLSASPGGGWAAGTSSPCLIDPALDLGSARLRNDLTMSYWPSYSDITPARRLAYLHWLSHGKRDPAAPVGFALLYFYGIERRLLLDDPSADETALLTDEIRRLRTLYGADAAFAQCTAGLLQIVELRQLLADGGLDRWQPDLLSDDREMPARLRLKLAIRIARRQPIDCEHALAAVLALQSWEGGIRHGISVTRTRPEFVELVRRRFAGRFRTGLRLRDRKHSRLVLGYRSVTRHLDISLQVEAAERLPDPVSLTWNKMTTLCEQASEDLAPYARLVGKSREHADGITAALALPPDLVDFGAVASFKAWLDGLAWPAVAPPIVEVDVGEVGRRCLGENHATLGLRQAREISAILAHFGYGMEPDPTQGAADRPRAGIMLFRAPGAAAPGPAFHRAALVTGVLASTDDDERSGARAIVELIDRSGLAAAEAVRLTARYRAVRGQKLPAARLRSLIEPLSADDREAAASLATAVISAGGTADHRAIAAIERLFDALGIERRSLYGALHRGAAAAQEPVIVERHEPGGPRHRIPAPPRPGPLIIDMTRLDVILRETREVAAVLAPIYEEAEPAPPPDAPSVTPPALADSRFPGLEAGHARFLDVVCRQERWPRTQFEHMAREFGLLPDGAVETINEWAYDALGDALLEEGDPVFIQLALLPETSGEAA